MEEKQIKEVKEKEIKYADYEFFRKTRVADFLSKGEEFFVLDMEKKKVYSSYDLRLRDLNDKLEKEGTAVFRIAQ